MYDCDCPYCEKTNTFWEMDGGVNKYIPVICSECGKVFYFLQRSWFDPYYDNANVEIRKKEWADRKLKVKKLKIVGDMKNEEGKVLAYIYKPLWDLYGKFGGEEEAAKKIKRMFSI